MAAWTMPNSALRAALKVSIAGDNLAGPFVPGSKADGWSDMGIDLRLVPLRARSRSARSVTPLVVPRPGLAHR